MIPGFNRQTYIARFVGQADVVPPSIHKAWNEMTADEQTLTVWHLRDKTVSLTRSAVAGHAIGCMIKANPETFTLDEINSLWDRICKN